MSDRKLLWLDIETTGLVPHDGRILEVGMIVTNANLEPIDRLSVVISRSVPIDRVRSLCDTYVLDMHTKSGLFDAVAQSTVDEDEAEELLISFVNKYFTDPKNKPELHGNTVHFDKKWLELWMPDLSALFNYRIVDVSTIKIMMRNYQPALLARMQDTLKMMSGSSVAHRALDDLRYSIKEYAMYLRELKINID